MVPMDLPTVALDMLKTFIYGQSFEDKKQSLGTELPSECSLCPICPEVQTQGKDASKSAYIKSIQHFPICNDYNLPIN